MPGPFPHERLVVYRKALPLYEAARVLVAHLRRQHWHLCDQLLRSVSSIVLNTAEASGEFRPAEKARFFRMALRSCAEAAAALEFLSASKLIDADGAVSLTESLREVAAMLSALARKR